MSVSYLSRSISMKEARGIIGNLAQTNQYFVNIPIPTEIEKHFEKSYNKTDAATLSGFASKIGFFCSEATLPVSSYATAEVKDNFMGVTQEFAHTRLYTDMDMTFYIDSNYDVLRFFEGWMDYISGAGEVGQRQGNVKHYYRRFVFPDLYKVDSLTITKFERAHDTQLVYTFINAFPKGLTSIPVSYGPAELLKVTVTFNFDRYVLSRERITSTGGVTPNGEPERTAVVETPESNPQGEGKGPPKAKPYLGNSQQSLDDLYRAAREGKIKTAADYVEPSRGN